MQKNNYTFFVQNSIFGLLIGVSFIVVSLVYYKTGQSICVNPQLNSVTMMLSIAGAFIGGRKYRDDHLGGIISYWKALGTCIYLITVAAFLYGIYVLILFHYAPSSQTAYFAMLEQVVTMLKEVYANSPLLPEIESMAKQLGTPFFIGFSAIFDKIFTGFIFSLFLAGLIRRTGKTF